MRSYDEIVGETRYRARLRWTAKAGSARVGVSEMSWEPGEINNLTTRYSALTLYQNAARIGHVIEGEERPVRKFAPGDLMLRPPDLDYTTRYEDPVNITVFALESSLVQSATTAFGANVAETFGRLEARPFRSPLIEGLARQLADVAESGKDRLYADALVNALVHELWRKADGCISAGEPVPGQICPRTLRKIDDAVADAPGGQVALEDLAGIANMPMAAFTTAMKETTGQTPYQYVLSRRVTLARDLIETTRLTLSEIAFQCGFSSQSHMTDVFRAKLGVSPGKLRAAKR